MSRPILSPRQPGIEKLIGNLPFDDVPPSDLRRFALACTRAASAWQVESAKRRASQRLTFKGGPR